MYIQRLTFSNVLSYGNRKTVIEFDPHEKIIGILGRNGAGKSTIFDVICIGLYGVPFRKINKPDVINRINEKELYVKIEFENKGSEWCIERGMKPNFIKIFRNGVELPLEAHSLDIQKYINTNIIGIDEHVFRQVMMVGMRNFKSFFTLPRDKRRELFETVINISILSNMKKKFQMKGTETERKLQTNTIELKFIDEKVSELRKQISHIQELSNESEANLQKEIEQLAKKTENLLQKQAKDVPHSLQELVDIQNNASREKTKLEVKLSDINKQRKERKEELTFFEKNNICPRCKSKLTSEQKEKEINLINEFLLSLDNEEREIGEKVEKIDEVLEEVAKMIAIYREYDKQIEQLSSRIKILKERIEEIHEVNANKKLIENIEQQIAETLEKKQTQLEEKRDLDEAMNIINNFKIILSDEGIKKYIYMNFLPILNKYINNILRVFEINLHFILEETLDEKILMKSGEVLKFDTFSNGEQQLLEVAFMFGLQKFLEKINNFNNRVCFIDELFDASIDVENLEKIINFMKNESDKQIIIITHKTGIKEYFDSSFLVKKEGNFSQITKEQ